MKSKIAMVTLLAAGGLFSGTASAVPWCHGGTIVTIQNTNWSEPIILANFTGSVPAGHTYPDYYITATAINAYGNTFAGGGGSIGGYTVPGSGQVKAIAYAPYSYTNTVSGYTTSQGISFKLRKCYTLPPMVSVKDKYMKHLPQTEANIIYWEDLQITDPNNDPDENR